jgi:hypothetical protein
MELRDWDNNITDETWTREKAYSYYKKEETADPNTWLLKDSLKKSNRAVCTGCS